MDQKQNKFHHLYYSDNKINDSKWNIIAWKIRKAWGKSNKNDKEWNVEIKDYSIMKENFLYSLNNLQKKFVVRYSKDNLLIRKKLNIIPKVYLKINTFKRDKLTRLKKIWDSLWMEFINYDWTISEYIVKLDIDWYEKFVELLKGFIYKGKWDKFEWNENYLKLFSDFSLLSENDRLSYYFDYLSEEWFITITTYTDEELTWLKDSISLLNNKLDIKIIWKSLVIKSWVFSKEEISILWECFDWIKNISSSNMKFNVDKSWLVTKINPLFNIRSAVLDNTVCVVDSWIEQVNYIRDYIDYIPWINFSNLWKNPLEDTKKHEFWHWTNVASIIIYWKQIHNWSTDITPVCKVCSFQIIDSWDETSIHFEKVCEWIKNIHEASWKKIKLFNLSISTRCLRKNEISYFSSLLDKLMHDNDILCILCTWNNECCDDMDYPTSWWKIESNITSPAESINWITVWSIWHPPKWNDYVSYYTRKDNIEFPSIIAKKYKKCRKKPDVLVYWWNKGDEFSTLWSNWNIVSLYWTSFATPYITHILILLKTVYNNITMSSLKALLINNIVYPENFNKNDFTNLGIDYNKLYWLGTIYDTDVENWNILFSSENSVTLLIESEFDFSSYKKQFFPFITTNIKMPKLKVVRWEHVKIKATLCYSPYVDLTSNFGDYNTCSLWFKLHYWDDSFNEKWNSTTEFVWLKWEKWSSNSSSNDLWNNTQIENFDLTKNEYNKLVENGVSLTIKAMLKRKKEVEEYYKNRKQKFSLVIRIEDEWNEWILYDSIKSTNALKTIVENDITLKSSLKL